MLPFTRATLGLPPLLRAIHGIHGTWGKTNAPSVTPPRRWDTHRHAIMPPYHLGGCPTMMCVPCPGLSHSALGKELPAVSSSPNCRSDVTSDVTSQVGLIHWEGHPDRGCNPTPTTASGFSRLCWAEERGHSPVTNPRATTPSQSHDVLAASAEAAAAATGGAGRLAENTRGW